jgi:signal transduction histidine kinase
MAFDGSLWFGSQHGLGRFDGNRVHLWPDALREQVRSRYFFDCVLDQENRLWFAGDQGLFCLNPDTFTLVNTFEADLDYQACYQVLWESEGERLWCATATQGVMVMAAGRLSSAPFSAHMSSVLPFSLAYDHGRKVLLIGSQSGLYAWSQESFQRVLGSHPHWRIFSVAQTSAGGLWVGTRNAGLWWQSPQDGNWHQIQVESPLGNETIGSVFPSQEGGLWVGTQSGLFRGLVQSKVFYPLVQDCQEVLDLCTGVDGTLFIGALTGLWRVRPLPFQRFSETRNSHANQVAWTVATNSMDEVWVGWASKGLSQWAKDRWRIFGLSDGLAHPTTNALLWHRDELWIGSDRGLQKWNGKNFFFDEACAPLEGQSVLSLSAEPESGWVWMGTQAGLLYREGPTGWETLGQAGEFFSRGIIQIGHLDRDRALVGTNGGGLFLVTMSSRSAALVPGTDHAFISFLARSGAGEWWAGAFGKGLLWYRSQFETELILPDSRLPLDLCYAGFFDQDDRLWTALGTELVVFDSEDRQILRQHQVAAANPHRFSMSKVLPDMEINAGTQPNWAKRDNGTVLLATNQGLLTVAPDRIRPPMAVNVGSVQVMVDGANKEPPFQLSSKTKRIQFSVEVIHPTTEAVSVESRLLGFDDRWQAYEPSQPQIYAGLPQGDYQWEVRARHFAGPWTMRAGAPLTIRLPWYRQPAHVLVLLLGIMTLGLMLFRWRLRQHHLKEQFLEARIQNQTQDLQNRYRELSETNETLNRFLGMAAHDLRNPLQGISAGLDRVRQKSQQGLPVIEDLRRMSQATKHMAELIKDLLTSSQWSESSHERKWETIDWVGLARAVLEEAYEQAERKGQVLILEGSAVCQVRADLLGLRRVMENLLSNAIKYAPPSTRISMTLRTEGRQVVMTLVDQGPGIALEQRALLFEPFQRLGSKTTAGEESTGLGLFIVKKIVEQLEGEVVYKDVPGGGACFVVTLPLADEEEKECNS